MRYCKDAGQIVLAVVNVPESSIAREADFVLPTLAGAEIGVASTKAFTCQLAALAALALALAKANGQLSADKEAELIRALEELPRLMQHVLKSTDRITAIAHELAKARDVLYLGRGALFPIALEGALKLKEISYIHAEGYAAGEMKHGPIALIDENVPVVVVAPTGPLFDKTISNLQEASARGGKVLLISDRQGLDFAGSRAHWTIEIPAAQAFIQPILATVPLQLLAYYAALARGTDVDQPRNLAKSVTVE
jgi:glucosamine--fructose-6-phosphate aminotransferase (isomerizing)